ncbi:MAG: hypothetical protein K6G76_11775 [Lachnospiraceae bacterium]|nr:hypothetical protein [Lachnospiraceae bacterium]
MADISISQGQMPTVNNFSTPAAVDNRTNVTNTNAPEVTKKEEKDNKGLENYLDDVIAVSEDGDTLQVKDNDKTDVIDDNFEEEDLSTADSSAVKLSERNIKTDVANVDERPEIELPPIFDDKKDTIEITDTDNIVQETNTTNITSYTGYTDTQLKQMYLDGEISKYNYDQEMESRKQEQENVAADSKDVTENVMNTVSGMERVSMDAEQLKVAFANNSNDVPDPAMRVEIMSALQDLATMQ